PNPLAIWARVARGTRPVRPVRNHSVVHEGRRVRIHPRSDHSATDRAPRVTHDRVRRVKAILPTLEIEHNAVSLGGDSPYKIWEIAATNPVLKLAVGTNL